MKRAKKVPLPPSDLNTVGNNGTFKRATDDMPQFSNVHCA